MHTHEDSPNGQAAYLRALRLAQGFTQQEVADKIGAVGNTISKIELGVYQPQRVLAKLLKALNGSLEDWFDLENTTAEEGWSRANDRIDRLRLIRKMTPEQINEVLRRRGRS